ncbi:hypothetical protein COT12_00695 [Candidatus Berkelbacteria bacterium CG08_land_8_20_14_0_20_39_8]|uniref:Uncharacterized protein n=1 Tax=Candidatus Berkelbacteria bacterium CG08_land_8_20_14_0_20_39_8 TaxID=1974511 RepID=A0A2M6YCS6_9BACT|nr:MAG: hypothetical protein COT12_00695 [Candidatus Berkelbacteria bacterium CG08_land_8_20_14_0_20_39_8]
MLGFNPNTRNNCLNASITDLFLENARNSILVILCPLPYVSDYLNYSKKTICPTGKTYLIIKNPQQFFTGDFLTR